MSPEELAASVKEQLKGRLGDMELVEAPFTIILWSAAIAQRFYGKRSALIGDAAVGMHPVTAHGFNLGLQVPIFWLNWFSKPSNAVRILVRRAC